MSKSNKPPSETGNVADKLRDSLSMEENKPDSVDSDLGFTSAATSTTTSSCSSSSSGSVMSRARQSPATRKSDSVPVKTSAVQFSKPSASSAAQTTKSSAPSTAQSKPSVPSGAKSSKATNLSAAQSKPGSSAAAQSKPSSSAAAQSKAGSSAAAQSGSSSHAGVKTGSSKKTETGNLGSGRGSATSDSTSGTAKPSGKSSNAPPQPVKIVPAGNLFPSGKVKITGMTQGLPRSTVLGSGAKSYGYGSIMRGSTRSPDADTLWKTVLKSTNPEEVKRIGNDMYKNGCFNEALKCYDRAIQLSPANATYHSNRGAVLSSLSRIGEAVNACDQAVKLDPKYTRAHHRLATLLLRLGQVENSGMHFYAVEDPPDPNLVKMLQLVDQHLNKCTEARRRGEWNIALTEVSSAVASGADCSPQLEMCKIEALLKLQRIDDAQTVLAFLPKVEPFPASFSQTPFFDINGEAYMSMVNSQLELTLGRFENAVTAAEKALEIDPGNSEVEAWYKNVKLIVRARDRGNNLFESERYTEASSAYTEGLKFAPHNAALFCHRADCFFKIKKWESSIEDYNRALHIIPSYVKPRLQRAAAYGKMERWAEAVKDYEMLKKEMPYDKEVAESLFHAQVVLKKSLGEVVLDMELGGEVEEISSLEELNAAMTRPGVSIVYFFRASNHECKEMSVFVEALCVRYPSLHFLKVEIEKCPEVGEAERVRVVPTFKICKLGTRIKEIVCPSNETLENSVRQYSL